MPKQTGNRIEPAARVGFDRQPTTRGPPPPQAPPLSILLSPPTQESLFLAFWDSQVFVSVRLFKGDWFEIRVGSRISFVLSVSGRVRMISGVLDWFGCGVFQKSGLRPFGECICVVRGFICIGACKQRGFRCKCLVLLGFLFARLFDSGKNRASPGYRERARFVAGPLVWVIYLPRVAW